jgi:hypothetical protein
LVIFEVDPRDYKEFDKKADQDEYVLRGSDFSKIEIDFGPVGDPTGAQRRQDGPGPV